MAIGDLVFASVDVGAGATSILAMTSFTDVNGDALSESDAVIVRDIVHTNDITISREGDPDDDGVFEISVDIESRTGGGNRTSDTLIYTDQARLGLQDDTGSGITVVMVGEQVDPSNIFVSQAQVAGNGEQSRTTGSRGQEEQVIEMAAENAFDIQRRYDLDDSGGFEVTAAVDSFASGQVLTEQWLAMVDAANRTNAAAQVVLVDTSGNANTGLMILGTLRSV